MSNSPINFFRENSLPKDSYLNFLRNSEFGILSCENFRLFLLETYHKFIFKYDNFDNFTFTYKHTPIQATRMSAYTTLALIVLLGFISVMVSSKKLPHTKMCMTTDACSTKIASAAKYALLNFDGTAGLNEVPSGGFSNNFNNEGPSRAFKVKLLKDSNPNDTCESVQNSCQTIDMKKSKGRPAFDI